jgi:hypothetical protein
MAYSNEYSNVRRVIDELKEVLKREDKRHQMDQHLDFGLYALIDEEIIPALEDYLDADPTPQYLYDATGGETPVSMQELHAASWSEHQTAHT